jgi:hypothetical protein
MKEPKEFDYFKAWLLFFLITTASGWLQRLVRPIVDAFGFLSTQHKLLLGWVNIHWKGCLVDAAFSR